MPSSLIDFKNWAYSDLDELLSLSQFLKQKDSSTLLANLLTKSLDKKTQNQILQNQISPVALLFFEPSTRTRMSFEMAAFRCGLGPIVLDGSSSSSLEKGESVQDTILNIAAMNPEFLVIRCSDSVPLKELAEKTSVKILNAGWGAVAHPTQALLDVMTMKEHWNDLSEKKLLIVGDVKHSRVASSHFELLPKLKMQIAICGPLEFLDDVPSLQGLNLQKFTSLDEGLQWADMVMALRVQFERHGEEMKISKTEYRKQYGLNSQKIKNLNPQGIILHPGPVNWGIEMESEISQDPKCQILQQVTNGVYIREALMRWLMGERA